MRTTLFIVFSIFIVFGCRTTEANLTSQKKAVNYIPYYLKVYEADSLYIIEDYQRSYEILDSLFLVYKPINLNFYREYETYVALSYLNGGKKLKGELKKLFQLYGSELFFIKNDSILNLALNKSKLKSHKINILIKKYRKSINTSLRDTIAYMVTADQACRNGEIDEDLLAKTNQQNTNLIIHVFEKYGYPSYKKIGYNEFDKKPIEIEPLFKHTENEFAENFLLPKLKESIMNGECEPRIYASLYDRLMIEKNEKQLYGSFYTNNKEYVRLIDSISLDSIRKSIGLPNINYEKWRLKKKYNIEY